MASVTRDKNGKYQVRYYVDDPDGVRRQRQKSFDRSGDAKRFASEIDHSILVGEYVQPHRVHFSAWLDDWLSMHASKIQINTLDGYKRNAEKAKAYFGSMLLTSILPSDIDKFYAKLSTDGLSGATGQRVHALLRRAFQDAVRDRLITRNPFDLVQRPKAIKPSFVPPTQDAIIALLNALDGTPYHLPTFLAAAAGLRLSEVLGLRWEDVDLNSGTITIRQVVVQSDSGLIVKQPKTQRSARTIRIPESLILVLKSAHKTQLENRLRFGEAYAKLPYVCVYQDGTHMSCTFLSTKTPETLEALGFPRCRFHDLRHANITFMLQQGVPIQAVSARAGHSNTSTTLNIYAHILSDMDDLAAAKLDGLFEKKNEQKDAK